MEEGAKFGGKKGGIGIIVVINQQFSRVLENLRIYCQKNKKKKKWQEKLEKNKHGQKTNRQTNKK